MSWPPSKVSKLENGRQTPTDEDIRGWTRATNSEGETEALLASLHTLEIQHAEWRRQLKTGLRPHQSEIAELDAKTRLFGVFESTVIPGLLQTAEYARARFAQGIAMFKVRNDDEWTDTVYLDGFSRDCYALRERRTSLVVPGSALVERRATGDALNVLNTVLTWGNLCPSVE